jgi:hypothetical protein
MRKPEDTNGETRRYKWWKSEDTNGGSQKMQMVENRRYQWWKPEAIFLISKIQVKYSYLL